MNRFLLAVPLFVLSGLSLVAPLPAQHEADDPRQVVERLRRDQDEILRKAGRMRDLMERLQQRYQREEKPEQVELLRQGLEHLDRVGLLKDVASIRDDLAANALSEAVRKQQEVVDDIERLLNILLQRRSIDNIEQAIQQATELAGRVRDLERQQAELQKQTQQAAEREATPVERDLDQTLGQLARDQAAEAQRNSRDAGARRPFLEDALRNVKELLQQQARLEARTEAERTGKADADRERAFDLGELIERARNLSTDVRDQGRQQDLARIADRLEQALQNGDQSGAQQAKDEMTALLQRAPNRPERDATPAQQQAGIADTKDWQQLREAAQKAPAGATPAERAELQQLAQQARKVADAREQAARTDNGSAASDLAKQTRDVAQRLDSPQPQAEASPETAAKQAAESLDRAAAAAQQGDTGKALEQTQAAQRQLEDARRRLREQQPDAQQLANNMAAGADATERELRNAPQAEDQERKAADSLDKAEQALREAADKLSPESGATPQPTAPQPTTTELQTSRQNLEQAQQTLEQALQQAGADRKSEMTAGAERQQQLQQRAQQAQQRMDQAGQSGELSKAQQQQAGEQLQKAEQAMQSAEQALKDGQQSTAGQRQRDAAQAIQQAQQALQKNRQPGQQQQQAMQDLAKQQQKLEEEILRLAQEAKQRKNPEATHALDEAGEAARRARNAMQQGDSEEADQQQQRTRQKLDEAAQQLEEERDRYLDQRQEELLFRMKEELLSFLEKQQPITTETEAIQKAAGADGPSRPARSKLKQFAEEEQVLAGRLQTLIAALTEEGNLVYRTVLQANHDDLQEVARRLSGRNPDPSNYTTMLQRDVERRTKDLLEALAREQKRREQERQQQQQQQQGQQGQNRFSPQRQKLVSLIAELEMLKQLEQDTRRATEDLRTLVELRVGDNVGDAEAALVERLLHRHAEVTKLFQSIKASVEEAMKSMQGEEEPKDGNDQGKGRPRGR